MAKKYNRTTFTISQTRSTKKLMFSSFSAFRHATHIIAQKSFSHLKSSLEGRGRRGALQGFKFKVRTGEQVTAPEQL